MKLTKLAGVLPKQATVDQTGQLLIAGCSVTDLVAEWGSPLLIYDQAQLVERAQTALSVFGEGNVFYAGKAFICKELVRLFKEVGLRFDVTGEGELATVASVGVTGQDIVLHGNNKSLAELEAGLRLGVTIAVDNSTEIEHLVKLARRLEVPATVLLRLNPAVKVDTHDYVATGQADSKFGFLVTDGSLERALNLIKSQSCLRLQGLHCHLGSQFLDLTVYKAGLEVVFKLARRLEVDYLSLGGGLGVAYTLADSAPSLADWGQVVKTSALATGFEGQLVIEPGRSLVAQAGLAVYTIGAIKTIPGVRNYVAVDGGLGDNPRPVLYQADYEAFVATDMLAERDWPVRVVGKYCESGDILVHRGFLPSSVKAGDLLVIPVSGAYHYSMSSNYHRLPRPAVVFVADGLSRLAIKRQTPSDLLAWDT